MDDCKRCAKCGEDKPTAEFPPGKKWFDGLYPYCRDCKRATQRADHAKHKAKRNTAAKARYEADPEPYKARANARYAREPESIKAQATAWAKANPDKRKIITAKWVQANLSGKVRESVRRRYARRKGAVTIPFTPEQLRQRMAYWGNRCWICQGPHEAVDHVKPLTKGGPHMLANLRPICRSCNARKGSTWPLSA